MEVVAIVMEMEVIMVVAAEVVCGGYGGNNGNTCYKCGKISHMGRKYPQSGESCGSYGGGRGGGDYDGSRGGGGRCFNYEEHFSREFPNDNIHYNVSGLFNYRPWPTTQFLTTI
ncbi:hypothetical protein L1987_80794 [Smallanthus sonchifolius]|uniref:Uncharacterized protein n=1 Tax=Smallanthus sonchifolius TaxID=185202 RepID=A0ACB8YNU7_9ASTR|nr:hypothetical protein L1987_80794 [Smallanthus sonchifolius]